MIYLCIALAAIAIVAIAVPAAMAGFLIAAVYQLLEDDAPPPPD